MKFEFLPPIGFAKIGFRELKTIQILGLASTLPLGRL